MTETREITLETLENIRLLLASPGRKGDHAQELRAKTLKEVETLIQPPRLPVDVLGRPITPSS